MKPHHIPVRNLVKRLNQAGHKCTLLGIGPVSELVVNATFEACVRRECPAIFIASRNQVDLKELGHGYLMGGMDQWEFTALLGRVQLQSGFDGPVYICRDHGGPWQRNAELDGKYPVAKAMDIAKKSFRADIEAGFNYLHIDPTKCPLPFTPDDLCAWTIELQAFCEDTRKQLGKPEIDYEVGTEDIQGGLTSPEHFESFLKQLVLQCRKEGLPLPTCVVGQTGTLTRMDSNVGRFNRQETSQLAGIAARYNVGFKEHNGDYISSASCRIHPDLGVTGMNVAPEFGLVETDACLALADMEGKLVREGWLSDNEASGFRERLILATFATTPWHKWLTNELRKWPAEKVEADTAARLSIARVCGHYVYDQPEIKYARSVLYQNVQRFGLVPDSAQFVCENVCRSIEFYLENLQMTGINNLLTEKCPEAAASS